MNFIEKIDLSRGNSAAGIHLFLRSNGEWHLTSVVLIKRKKLIHLANHHREMSTIEDIEKYLPANMPIILSIEGKGVIHKKVTITESADPLQQVFPNARQDDFFLQSQSISENELIISIVRKNTLDEIVKSFIDKGYHVCHAILGPFSLNTLWESFDQQQNSYLIENYAIVQQNGHIVELNIEGEKSRSLTYTIGNESIESDLLIPYSNAISYLLKNELELNYSVDICRTYREQFIYGRLIRLSSFSFLGVLFFMLLVNFILYDKYSKALNNANIQFKSGLELVNRIDSLKAKLEFKEKLVAENGLLYKSRYSFYADRIAALVPNQIVLNRLDINPSSVKRKEDKELGFERNMIAIKGMCLSGFVLDNWINALKRESWIKQIEIIHYTQDSKNSPGDFFIQIEY